MSTDLRSLISDSLRHHPRVQYQSLCTGPTFAADTVAKLKPMPAFRDSYSGAISVVDWDHRLPSANLTLRIYGYYEEESLAQGKTVFQQRVEMIADRDRFPEFDVPDFEDLPADEAYELELSVEGEIGEARLTSGWRRNVGLVESGRAILEVRESQQFRDLVKSHPNRPAHLGDLEAVSWAPPCETEHPHWTVDVWYLLGFDGRIGTGQSFLVDLNQEKVVDMRDFSVRAG